MKVLHRLAGLMLCMGLLGGALHIIRISESAERWQGELARLGDVQPVVAASVAVAVICLLAVFLLSGIPVRRRKRKLLSFDNEGGTVSISTDAICDYVSKLAEEFPSIVKLVPEVVTTRNAIDIIIGVRVKAGPQIHEVCELLQQRARESLTNGLGISQIRRVEVSVNDIASEHRPK